MVRLIKKRNNATASISASKCVPWSDSMSECLFLFSSVWLRPLSSQSSFSMVPVACPQSGNPCERRVWGGAGETISPVIWIWTTVMGTVVQIQNTDETVSPNATASCQYYSTYCTFKTSGGNSSTQESISPKFLALHTINCISSWSTF